MEQTKYHDKIERYYLTDSDMEKLLNNEDIDIVTKDNRHIKIMYDDSEITVY